MCGIVSIVNKAKYGFTRNQETAFYEMLFADQLRGDDSTGAIMVMNDTGFGILKDAYPAYWMIEEFANHNIGKDLFSKGKAAIGHNRKATIGKIEAATAHPFVVDKTFAMVHNGTLRNHKQLADTTVDSEALAIHLSKVLTDDFDKEKFEEAMGKVEGAYAVVAYNQKTNCVYFMRNHERPLALIETPSEWLISSEFGLASWIGARNGLSHKDQKAEIVETETLYKIDLDTNTLTKEKFTPKKTTAHHSTVQHGGMVVGWKAENPTAGRTSVGKAYDDEINEVSKNEFKRLRKKLALTTVTFWADDYVEKNFPKSFADGETEVLLMGECEAIQPPHVIEGLFDTKGELQEHELIGRMYSARVYDMDFNKVTGQIKIRVDRVQLIPPSNASISKKHEASTTVH